MIVLADNDLILKLAQCGLLNDLPQLLGVDALHEIFVSSTAKFQLLPKNEVKALSKAGNEATLHSIKEFLGKVAVIPEVQDESVLVRMEGIPGIDFGEQQLLAAMLELDHPLLVTGDKRALMAVANNEAELSDISRSLQDRVLTFESAILLALTAFGFPNVKQRLLGNPKPDSMLKLVLKDGMQEKELVDCLVSYSRQQFAFLARKDILSSYYEQ